MSDYLKDCADKAVMVFKANGIKPEHYLSLLESLFKDMELIYHGISKEQIDELKGFGFNLYKMNMDERRSILFQMSLCRVLCHQNEKIKG